MTPRMMTFPNKLFPSFKGFAASIIVILCFFGHGCGLEMIDTSSENNPQSITLLGIRSELAETQDFLKEVTLERLYFPRADFLNSLCLYAGVQHEYSRTSGLRGNGFVACRLGPGLWSLPLPAEMEGLELNMQSSLDPVDVLITFSSAEQERDIKQGHLEFADLALSGSTEVSSGTSPAGTLILRNRDRLVIGASRDATADRGMLSPRPEHTEMLYAEFSSSLLVLTRRDAREEATEAVEYRRFLEKLERAHWAHREPDTVPAQER